MSYIYAQIKSEKEDLQSFLNTAINASKTYLKMITDTADQAIQN